MRLSQALSMTLISVSIPGTALAAGDAAAGKKKSMSCAACHGNNGMAVIPNAPNLAGQSVIYLKKALHDFKTGVRKNENMSVVIGQLTDQDMDDLAAYYASFQVTVTPPK